MIKSTESQGKSRRRGSSLEVLVGEFHTHIDAQTLSTPFEKFLIDRQQFCYADFSGHPEGFAHCPPSSSAPRVGPPWIRMLFTDLQNPAREEI